MKKIFAILILIFLFTTKTQGVQAHVLKTSGSIGAVMHVTPDDDPIAGVESNFYFEFKDKEGKFTPKNCKCIVSVIQSGKEVFSQDLFNNYSGSETLHANLAFTFPQRDIYKIKIDGTPKNPQDFKAFTLIYDVRVERISKNIENTKDEKNLEIAQSKNPLLDVVPIFIFTFFGIVIILNLIAGKFTRK